LLIRVLLLGLVTGSTADNKTNIKIKEKNIFAQYQCDFSVHTSDGRSDIFFHCTLLRIRAEIFIKEWWLSLKLGTETDYPQLCRSFLQYVQARTLRSLASSFLPGQCSWIIISFDDV
jgi:hypothetical protein